jgi:hypothetical protein
MQSRIAMGDILGGCTVQQNRNSRSRPVVPNSGRKEFSLKDLTSFISKNKKGRQGARPAGQISAF